MNNIYKFLYLKFDIIKDLHSTNAPYEIFNEYSKWNGTKIKKEEVPYLLECIKNFTQSTLKEETKRKFVESIAKGV